MSSTATFTTFSPTAQAHPSPSPVVPTQQHFTQKLENLKKVLPFANEVKLASLPTRAQGDMDAVVQEILDSSNNLAVEHTHDATGEAENLRIINLTGPDDDKKCFTETTTAKSTMANNFKQHGCRACRSRYILDLYYISRSTKMQRKQSKMLLPARESFFYFLCTIFIRGPQILSPRKVYIVSFEQCFLQILDNLRVPKQF